MWPFNQIDASFNSVVISLAVLTVWFATYFIWLNLFADRNLPPSPWQLPVIGHLHLVNACFPQLTLTEWAQRFGPITKMYLGDVLHIVLNDYDMISEAMTGSNGEHASGRPHLPQIDIFSNGNRGLIFSEGDLWKEQRRFTISVLRDFGFGKGLMAEKIRLEVDKLVQYLTMRSTDPAFSDGTDMVAPLKLCTGNVISSVILGRTFEQDDETFIDFQQRVQRIIQNFLVGKPETYIKPLRWAMSGRSTISKLLLGFMKGFLFSEMEEDMTAIREDFLRKQIRECAARLPERVEDAADLASVYMLKTREMEKNGQTAVSGFSDTQLEAVLLDLFVAGHETSVTTTTWALLAMLHFPEIQAKVQTEIDSLVGRVPNWEDRNSLPFTMATITEVHRFGSILPLGVFHRAQATFQMAGYTVPKGATLIANLWAAHKDPKTFSEPAKFKPDRFIDADSGQLRDTEKVIPFGLGKRSCLGESMGRMEVFALITSLLYHFTLTPADVKTLPRLTDPMAGGIVAPKPFKVHLSRRH